MHSWVPFYSRQVLSTVLQYIGCARILAGDNFVGATPRTSKAVRELKVSPHQAPDGQHACDLPLTASPLVPCETATNDWHNSNSSGQPGIGRPRRSNPLCFEAPFAGPGSGLEEEILAGYFVKLLQIREQGSAGLESRPGFLLKMNCFTGFNKRIK